jgi:hypothetical protein
MDLDCVSVWLNYGTRSASFCPLARDFQIDSEAASGLARNKFIL